MSLPIIEVDNVSKRYRLGQFNAQTLREELEYRWQIFRGQSRSEQESGIAASNCDFWALRGVSFCVQRGEVTGLIGRNGAGKSTLLKILSRVTEPSSGQARLRGRAASLLEVGTGFHPELTGRENVYLNGAILGMSKAEVRRKFDEIVAFAEISKFIDTPVKRYSSGMYTRLAFAVAAHLEPEILIVDEVLAVGDTQFQKKCLGKMSEVAKGGRTILFVSHNMAAIQNLCSTVIHLHQGEVVRIGPTASAIQSYLHALAVDLPTPGTLEAVQNRSGTGTVRFTDFHVEDVNGNHLSSTMSGAHVVFVLRYQLGQRGPARDVDVGFSIHTQHDQTLFVLYSSYTGITFDELTQEGEFRCLVRRLPLAAGRYYVGARVTSQGDESDWPRDRVGLLDVDSGDYYQTGRQAHADAAASMLVDGEWSVRLLSSPVTESASAKNV